MSSQILAGRDEECSPTQYQKLLKETHANARRILALPDQQWPKGSSHDLAMALLAECEEAYENLVLEHGLYSLRGELTGFAD